MRKLVWLFVLSWIEKSYLKKGDKVASCIVDCCIFIKEKIME